LRTDRLDVLLLHSPPREVLERGEFTQAFDHLKRTGKARYVGLSLRSLDDAAALAGLSIDCVQVDVNARSSPGEREAVDQIAAAGVAVLARQPFGGGTLVSTGAGDCDHRDVKAALRLALIQPVVASVVAGMTRPRHVDANADAIEDESFSSGELEELQSQFSGRAAP
jgi:aryl-alcohol dehydrogenase-like predicted oxidoreductase